MKTPIKKEDYLVFAEAGDICQRLLAETHDNGRFMHAKMVLKALCREFEEGEPKEKKRKNESHEEVLERLEKLSLEIAKKRE